MLGQEQVPHPILGAKVPEVPRPMGEKIQSAQPSGIHWTLQRQLVLLSCWEAEAS